MEYAIVEVGCTQVWVQEGQYFVTNKISTNAGIKKPFIVKKKTPNIGSAFSGKGNALNAAKYQKNICNNKGIFLKNST